MGQIIKSLSSFCKSVYKHSYGRNFDSILMEFCTVIQGPKSKIKFVWGWKSNDYFPYFAPFYAHAMHFQWEGFHTTVNKPAGQ